MSALASPAADYTQSPVFFYDSRYRYHHAFEDEAAVLALPTAKPQGKRSALLGLMWLGQFCADRKNRGWLTKLEVGQCWTAKGVTRSSTRTAWRRKLVESGALIEHSDGYQLKTYARFNRTPEEWAEVDRKRRAYKTAWEANKRADVLSQDQEVERLEFIAEFGDASEQPLRCTSSGFPDSVDSHYIERCESEPAPPRFSPEGVAPPGPTPTPPSTPQVHASNPNPATPPSQETPPRKPLKAVQCSPLRARSLGVCLAPGEKRENQNRGTLGSADAYPNPKAGESKPGESKATPQRHINEYERMVLDIMRRQGIPIVPSADQGVVAE